MNLRLDRINRIRLAIVLLALALVAGLGTMTNSALTAPPSGSAALAPSGASAAYVPAGAGSYAAAPQLTTYPNGVTAGKSYYNDVSPALRDMKPIPVKLKPQRAENENPSYLTPGHINMPDQVVQRTFGTLSRILMPAPVLNFDGIPFPGVVCNCA